jgi:hypothetical protein
MPTCWVCGDLIEPGAEICSDPKCGRLAERLLAEDPMWVANLRRREAESRETEVTLTT